MSRCPALPGLDAALAGGKGILKNTEKSVHQLSWIQVYLENLLASPNVRDARHQSAPFHIADASAQAGGSPADFGQVLTSHRRIIVIGPARFGKTTLLLSILHDYASQASGKGSGTAANLSYCEETRIPIYLDLEQLTSSHSLEGLASRTCSDGLGQEITTDSIADLLSGGECLVLLDHMDRLVGRQHLQGLSALRDFMVDRYPQQRYVLALPEHEYPLLEDWLPASHTLRLDCLIEEEVLSFLHAQHGEAQARRINRLLRTRRVWDLVRDPFFLPVVAGLVGENEQHDPTRAQLLSRTMETALAGAEKYRATLAGLALELLREGREEFDWSTCQEKLDGDGQPSDSAESCRVLLNSGILRSDAQARKLSFRHSSFQDFLAGEAVGRALESGASLSSVIGSPGKEWMEPLSLLYGSFGRPGLLVEALITPDASLQGTSLACYCVIQNEERGKVREALHPRFFDPQANFLLGKALRRFGYLEEARLELEEALRFRPERTDIHFELGQVMGELGKAEGALAAYQRVSTLGPPSIQVTLQSAFERARLQGASRGTSEMEAVLGDLDTLKAQVHAQLAVVWLEAGRRDAALAQATECLRLAPSAESLSLMGRIHSGLGNSPEAKSLFEQALEHEPGFVPALLGLATVHERAEDLDEALALYKAVLCRDPQVPGHYLNLGRVYRQKGLHLLSKAYTAAALDLDPGYHAAFAEMAALLEAQERYNEAVEQLRRAIDICPMEAAYFYRLGWLLKLAGRPVHAEKELRAAIDLGPDRAEYYNQLGVVLAEMDRRREALGAYQRASQLDAGNPLYHRNVGVALAQLGHNQEALRTFDRALELCASTPSEAENVPMSRLIAADAHSERGQILERLGDTHAALAEYEAAVELMPTESAYRLRQALAGGHFSDPSRMLQVLRRTVQLRPHDGSSHHLLGEALEAIGELEEAQASFRRAVEQAPEDGRFWMSLGRVQRVLGEAGASVESLTRVRDLRSADSDSHHQLGLSLEQAGRLQEAEESYRSAARLDVNRVDYWMALGRCCRNQGKLAESQAALRRVLFLDPANARAHSEIAETHLRQGRQADALSEAICATKGDPEVGYYQHQVARIYRSMGLLRETLAFLNRATQLDPDRSDWRRDLGQAFEEAGELESALAQFEDAAGRDPECSHGLYLLGRLHHRLGRAEEAFVELERSVELDPTNAEASLFLSRLLLERGEAAKALEHCRALMPVVPDNPQPFYLGFKALLKLGREGDAIEVLEKATSLRPDDPDWQRELGECYSGVGRLLEAQQSYQRALELRGDPELRRELAHLYQRMGWKQEAIRELGRALEEGTALDRQTRGLYLLDLGDFHQDSRSWDEASSAYESAGLLLGETVEVHERRTALLVRMGRYQEAKNEVEEAMARGFSSPRFSHTLSMALEGLGDIEGAARQAIKAAFGDPANANFQRHLGSLLRMKGDLSSAINYLQRAVDLSPGEPHNLHEMGLALEDKGNCQEALRLFRQACELSPEEPDFHLDFGRLLLELGEAEQAVVELERAVEDGAENARSHFLLARALEDRGYLERANEQYEAAVRLDGRTPAYHFHLAKAREALGDFAGAIRALRLALDLDESQASWHSDLASLYSRMGESELARNEHLRALDLAPQNYEHYLRAGIFYRETGASRESLTLLEKATAIAPGRPEAFHQLGLARLDLGLSKEALRSIQRAVELAPADVYYQIDLANAYRLSGDYAEAARRLLNITRELPESAEAHCSLGLALADQRWHGEAVAPLAKAVELDPAEPRYRCALARSLIALGQFDDAHQQLLGASLSPSARGGNLLTIGSILEEMGKLEDALTVYRQGLEREQRGELYYQAARVLRLLRREADAVAALQAALALEERAFWQNELGDLLEEQGQISEAVPCFQRAVRMEPKDPIYHRNLGVALEKLHRYDAAREALEEAVRLRGDYRDALGHLASVTAKLTLEREVKKRSSQH